MEIRNVDYETARTDLLDLKPRGALDSLAAEVWVFTPQGQFPNWH
jgi:hypothetical protein